VSQGGGAVGSPGSCGAMPSDDERLSYRRDPPLSATVARRSVNLPLCIMAQITPPKHRRNAGALAPQAFA